MNEHEADNSLPASSAERDAAGARLSVMAIVAYSISVACGVTILLISSYSRVDTAPAPHAQIGISLPEIVMGWCLWFSILWIVFSPVLMILLALLGFFESSIRRHFLIWSALAIVVFNALVAILLANPLKALGITILLSTFLGSVAFSFTGWLWLRAIRPIGGDK